MNRLRTILYWIVFVPGSALYSAASVLIAPHSAAAAIAIPRAWARFHYACVRWLLGIEVRVEGTLPQTGVILAFKHESLLETFETLRLLERPAVVFKAELLRVPLWGRAALAHGVIPIEREAGASALRKMLTAARAAVAAGRPVLIFPEGTLVAHGERPPIRPGIAGLYKVLGLPSVTVAVDSGRVWPRSFAKRPGVVTLLVGEPIPPGLPRDEVEARVFEGINALNPPMYGERPLP